MKFILEATCNGHSTYFPFSSAADAVTASETINFVNKNATCNIITEQEYLNNLYDKSEKSVIEESYFWFSDEDWGDFAVDAPNEEEARKICIVAGFEKAELQRKISVDECDRMGLDVY